MIGRRQLDVLRSAEAGNVVLRHGRQGRSYLYGVNGADCYPDTVGDKLVDLGLIDYVDDPAIVNGCRVVVTAAGVEYLAQQKETA